MHRWPVPLLACALLVACTSDDQPAADAAPPDHASIDRQQPDAPPVSTGKPPAIDGLFDDWAQIATLATDPAGDAKGAFDITAVKAAGRGALLYLYFDIGKTLNLHAGATSDGALGLVLSVVKGKQLVIDMRKREAYVAGTAVRWHEIGYLQAPTHAGKAFELRVDLSTLGATLGDTVTIDFTGSDALKAPASLELAAPAYMPALRSTDRAAKTTFRVASLNTLFDGLTNPLQGPPLRRLVKAAAADIYCLQEVFNDSATKIASTLTAVDPYGDGASWSAVKTGDTVVATRGTIKALPSQSATGQAFTGAAIDIAGRSVVVFSVRPVCCGYIGSIADLQRIAQLKQLAATIKKLRDSQLGAELVPWAKAPVVVAGDWNLVGSRTPLDVMEDKTTGPGLTRYLPRHLHGADAYTWFNAKDKGHFPPGILDVVVHSPELKAGGGFVLDTADLDSSTLTKLKLKADDSRGSDHLLLVADLGS